MKSITGKQLYRVEMLANDGMTILETQTWENRKTAEQSAKELASYYSPKCLFDGGLRAKCVILTGKYRLAVYPMTGVD